jgi:hypothetical protein
MPAILEKAVQKIKAKGNVDNPWAVATASLQRAGDLKKGTNKATKQGALRGKMTSAQRHAKPLAIGGAAKKPHLGKKGPWRRG